MKYIFTITLVFICFFSNAQNFLKSEISNRNGNNYSIILGLSASFSANGRSEVYNIRVEGTPDNTSNFISEDVTNFFVSTVIIEELNFIASKTGKKYESSIYTNKLDPNNTHLILKLTLKPDRIIVKVNRTRLGNLPDIPVKEFLYSKYMR